jgi:hypothetical protein
MPARKSDEIYVANTSGAVEIDGESLSYTKGQTRIRNSGTGAKILKQAASSFDPVDDRVHYDDVEQATAAPGEKRGTPKDG